MQAATTRILILVTGALCAQLARASYLLTHTNSRTMGTFTPDMCVAPELELQRMEPKNLTQYVRTPLESVRTRLVEDTKASQGHLQLASSRRSLQAVRQHFPSLHEDLIRRIEGL